MGARVEGLIDAGPYEQASYFASDEAAKQVSNMAEQLHTCLTTATSAAPAPSQTLVVMTASNAAPVASSLDQSTWQLVKELFVRLLPNWPEFFANLIIFVILLALLYGTYQIYCCLFSFQRRSGARRPYVDSNGYSDVTAMAEYLNH